MFWFRKKDDGKQEVFRQEIRRYALQHGPAGISDSYCSSVSHRARAQGAALPPKSVRKIAEEAIAEDQAKRNEARSKSRSGSGSGTKKKKKPRRPLTPAERTERIKLAIGFAIFVIMGGLTAYAVFYD